MIATKQHPRIIRALKRFDGYVDDVMAGRLNVCKNTRRAVKRHVKDCKRPKKWGYWFDRDAAGEAIAFIEGLRQSKGEWAGKPLILQPWQCFIIGSMFGWKRRGTDFRRFRLAYVEVPRKNGKSTVAAGVALKLFVGDREGGAEVYSTATTREQAKIVHTEAKRMVRKCPALRPHIRITRDNMEFGDCKYEPLPADGTLLDGRNPSGCIVDELHAHKSRELFDAIDTGTGARDQALLFVITTAGESNHNSSVGWELHDYTEKVLEGTIEDETHFGIIYALDEKDSWEDEKNWPKANPNLGVSVKLPDLRSKVKKAQQAPAAAISLRQKHFNEWVGSLTTWLPSKAWQKAAGDVDWYGPEGLTREALDHFYGRPCWVGVDLSSVRDLTAVCAAFPNDDEGIDLLAWAWCPRNTATGKQRDRKAPYLSFADQGHMEITDRESVDYDAIRAHLLHMRDDWGMDIQEIAADPANAVYFLTKLETEDGWDEDQIVKHRQGAYAMNDPIKATEKLLLDGRLRHGGNRCLAWCVANAVAHVDTNGNVKLCKERSREKIDLAVSMVMAVGRAVAGDAVSESSVYDSRGVLIV